MDVNCLFNCLSQFPYSACPGLSQKEKTGGGYMKSIGDRSGRQEKAKWGNLWDQIKSKTNRHISVTQMNKKELTINNAQ